MSLHQQARTSRIGEELFAFVARGAAALGAGDEREIDA